MSSDRIAELFIGALERPQEEREAYLEAAAANAPELRSRVARLLAAHQMAGDFLDAPLDPARAAALFDEDEGLEEEARIGPYRIDRELGRGGMGTVYLAQRADGQFEHQVALKVIKRGMDSAAILRRFLYERQILARLQHPQIARLYDGGLAEDGRPYFAMEYVDGLSITRYCAEKRLGVQARLRLFQDVCSAVQHAHANLVVHRDLKPSNVLVTRAGEVKLLDFGIARLLAESDEAEATALTEVGQQVMTPEYAAPEQVVGGAVTTATDVYGLGLVFYELLTGHRPYRFERRTPEEMARVLSETEPQRPSTAVGWTAEVRRPDGRSESLTPQVTARERGTTPERLRRQLSGDLDRVALKALAKEPERRYASAEALLEDVGRHLAGLPVRARRDTLPYRAAKFVRRHRVGVLVSAAFVLLLGGSVVTLVVQQAQTVRERDKAEAVRDFLLSLFEASNPVIETKGDSVTARELLERGAARVEAELADQPETQAEMLAVLGNAYYELGRYDRAAPLLERALALRRETFGLQHLDVAQSLHDLALLVRQQGDYEAADSLFREALAMRRELLRDGDPSIASSLNELGLLMRTKGDYDGAEPFLREALAMRRELPGEGRASVATTLDYLAAVLSKKGDYDGAEPLFREALAIRREHLGNEHPDVATSLSGLAVLLRLKGDLDAAQPLFREALAMRRALLGNEHANVATSLNNLALLLRDKEDYDGAEPLFREALAIYRQQLGEEHLYVATVLSNLGLVLQEKGDYAAAEPLHREALAIYRQQLGEENLPVATALTNLAGLLRRKGDFDAAEALFHQALDLFRDRLPEGHATASTLEALGYLVTVQDRHDEAEPLLREALEIRDKESPEGSLRSAVAQSLLGACLSALGRFEEAEPLLLAAYDGLREFGASERETRRALERLVAHYDRRDQPDQAASYRARLQAESTPAGGRRYLSR